MVSALCLKDKLYGLHKQSDKDKDSNQEARV